MQRMGPCTHPPDDLPLPAAMMCHIFLLNSALERAANRCTEQHGLTLPQWLALGFVSRCGPEGIRHSELGHRLMLSKAPITGIVDRLGRAGFVQRRDDAVDRRVIKVIITPLGESTWLTVRQSMREFAARQCASFTVQEQQTFMSFLARLMDTVGGE